MSDSVRSRADAVKGMVVEPWGSLTWLASSQLLGAKGITVGRVVIKKGHNNSRHAHPNAEEVLYLLAGRLEHTVGNERVMLEPGDTVLIPAGVFHNAYSIGETDADMIVTYSTAERSFVLEKGAGGE